MDANGLADPYFKIHLRSSDKKDHYRSEMYPNTLNVEFNAFQITVTQPAEKCSLS